MKQKTNVLFISSDNNFTAQMAEQYLLHMGGNIFDVRSAYLKDAFQNASTLFVLVEDGMEYKPSRTHKLKATDLEWADQIVVIGEIDIVDLPGIPPGKQVLYWTLGVVDSSYSSAEDELDLARNNRNTIKTNVNKMLTKLII